MNKHIKIVIAMVVISAIISVSVVTYWALSHGEYEIDGIFVIESGNESKTLHINKTMHCTKYKATYETGNVMGMAAGLASKYGGTYSGYHSRLYGFGIHDIEIRIIIDIPTISFFNYAVNETINRLEDKGWNVTEVNWFEGGEK